MPRFHNWKAFPKNENRIVIQSTVLKQLRKNIHIKTPSIATPQGSLWKKIDSFNNRDPAFRETIK